MATEKKSTEKLKKVAGTLAAATRLVGDAEQAIAEERQTAEVSVEDLRRELETLKQLHHEATVQAEERFKQALADAVQKLRAAEIAKERELDEGVSDRLAAATEKLTAPDEASKLAQLSEDERTRERHRARVAPAVAKAKRVYNQLIKAEIAYGARLNALSGLSRDTLLEGLPRGNANQINASVGLVNQLIRLVETARDAIASAKGNIETYRPEVERLAEHGWVRMDRQGFESAMVESLHYLGCTNDDMLGHIHTLMASITAASERIAELKRQAAESGEVLPAIVFEDRGAIAEQLQKTRERRDAQHPSNMPGQADVNYSPYR